MMKFNDIELIVSKQPSKKAAYILEDGSFINLQENKIQLCGYSSRKDVSHGVFVDYLRLHKINIDDLNAIRINDGTYMYYVEEAYIELPRKKPTQQQFDSLLTWLDNLLLYTKKQYVVVGICSKSNHYDIKGMNQDDVLKDIKRMYENN